MTVNAPETVSLYRDIPFSALFKYDGFDGGGDPVPAAEVDVNGDGFLDYATLPIHKTVALVRQIEKEAGRSVMPVMVIYTANASGGSALADLQDEQSYVTILVTLLPSVWRRSHTKMRRILSRPPLCLTRIFSGRYSKDRMAIP